MKQDSLDLYADKPFLQPLPPLPRKLSLPMRKGPNRNLFTHFALIRCHLYPPARVKPLPAKPECDESKFHVMFLGGWTLVCNRVNLPAFKTDKDLSKWMEFSHSPILMKWRCWFCECLHQWTIPASMVDTNGGMCAGADEIPARILLEYMHPKSEKIFLAKKH